MKKFFLFAVVTLMTASMWAAVGPQTVLATFHGNTAEGWQASSGGSITSVADGVANVQMALQSNNKYRADFQNQVAGTFAIDKTRDIVWAIKLTAPLPGTANSRKFEFQYKDADNADKWVNGINGPSGQIDCVDGGRIYYFNLGADGLNKLGALQDGAVSVNKVHFIFADAVVEDAADAHYSVDWIATFTSVGDLMEFADWKDLADDNTLPYVEMMFRLNNATSYDGNFAKNGFRDDSFEGNYHASIFAVEYFLIEDFSAGQNYTLTLTTVGAGGTDALSIWDFPYQVSHATPAEDMNTYVTAVVGYAPATTGTMNEPIATSECTNSVWTFSIASEALTPLTTIGTKTLVAVLVTSNVHDADAKGKYASMSHETIARPSLTRSGVAAIINSTQHTVEATLEEAVEHANAGDVISLYDDVTISAGRLEIKKELTIRGATGEEQIICDLPANSIMILANGNEADYTVTFSNLVVDGQGERAIQLFDSNGKAKLAFEGVSVINTSYSVVTGDVKSAGSNIILSGTNSFPNGIYLNRDKRIDNVNTTHTEPIKIILSGDYREDYAIVLHCADATLYTAVDAMDTIDWQLYVAQAGSNRELKGRKVAREVTAIDQQMVNGKCPNGKFIKDGQLIIRRGEKQYNALGAEL